MKTISNILLITTIFLFPIANIKAHNNPVSVLNLKSCNLDITADQITYLANSINFSGNVKFLYGFANVISNNVTLIKDKDGSCKLIARPWNEKKASY